MRRGCTRLAASVAASVISSSVVLAHMDSESPAPMAGLQPPPPEGSGVGRSCGHGWEPENKETNKGVPLLTGRSPAET